MTRRRIRRAKLNVEAWLVQYPELESRPHLVAAMSNGYHQLRARFFTSAEALDGIASGVMARGVAEKCLALWWHDLRRQLYVYWHDRLRSQSGSDVLFNELFGCLRNIYYNDLLRIGSQVPIHYSEHDKKRGTDTTPCRTSI